MEIERKSGKRGFEKEVERKERSKRPKRRSKPPEGKGGQRKLLMTTVFWDPALPRCLKRSITSENISLLFLMMNKSSSWLIPSFPWMCSLKEAGFSGRHRCGVTLLSGTEYFDICCTYLGHVSVCALPFVCVLPEFEAVWHGQTSLDLYLWESFHRTRIIWSCPRVCSSL